MTDVPQLPGKVTDSIGRVTERSPSAAIAITAIISISVVLGVIIWKLLDDQHQYNLNEHERIMQREQNTHSRLMYVMENWGRREPAP